MHAEDHNSSLRIAFYDLRSGIDPIQFGHEDVHDDDVGIFGFREFDGLASITRFANDLELVTLLQLHAQSFSNNTVIVSDENSYAFHASTPRGTGISNFIDVPPRW